MTSWITVTTIGSPYEEEVSECGRYWQHRAMRHGNLAALTGGANGDVPFVDLPWQVGRAPWAPKPRPATQATSVPSVKGRS